MSDLEGLLQHLGEKIGCAHVCLTCGSQRFRSAEACQSHMRDANHCHFSLESAESLGEYMHFYDFSALYEEDDEEGDDDDDDVLVDEGAFLVLPSGNDIFFRVNGIFLKYKYKLNLL